MCKTTTTTSSKLASSSSSAKNGGNEIPAAIPSGFPYYRNQMAYFFVFLTALYFGVIAFFDTINAYLQLPPSAPELCPDPDIPCWRADLFSFEVGSGVALCWCGIIGFRCWHFQTIDKAVPQTPEGRLFGYIPQAHLLTALQTTFQLFDLFISFLIPEQRTPIMIAHHTMAATVAWYGLNNQYFHYYGVFYLGCSEFSTIPLIFIDVANYFPPTPDSNYDFFIGAICGPLFAVIFTFYRVLAWWKVSKLLFEDSLYVLRSGISNKLRPGRNHVLYVMMTLNLLLGFLQLYWFRMIIDAAMELLF